MPEGDTVWLAARRLHEALAGRPLVRFDLRVPSLATVDYTGSTIEEVLSRGKHVLMRLDNERTLRSHLRMDGSWRVTATGARLPSAAHEIRAIVGNSQQTAVGVRVHDLAIVRTVDEHQLVGHLGPDLLGPDWSPEEAVKRLAAEPARPIGEALLDQRNLAGIGNVYKSEVLFLCGVNPWTKVGDVADLDRVVRVAQKLLDRNKGTGRRSTTGSRRAAEEYWVYLRHRDLCRRCGTLVRSGWQGDPGQERSTFWCPRCQPQPE